MSINRLGTHLSSVASLLFLLAANLFGQSPQGTITGTVTDAQGASLSNAIVTVLRIATNQKFTAVSSDEGVYAIPSLPIGEYEVTVATNGFSYQDH